MTTNNTDSKVLIKTDGNLSAALHVTPETARFNQLGDKISRMHNNPPKTRTVSPVDNDVLKKLSSDINMLMGLDDRMEIPKVKLDVDQVRDDVCFINISAYGRGVVARMKCESDGTIGNLYSSMNEALSCITKVWDGTVYDPNDGVNDEAVPDIAHLLTLKLFANRIFSIATSKSIKTSYRIHNMINGADTDEIVFKFRSMKKVGAEEVTMEARYNYDDNTIKFDAIRPNNEGRVPMTGGEYIDFDMQLIYTIFNMNSKTDPERTDIKMLDELRNAMMSISAGIAKEKKTADSSLFSSDETIKNFGNSRSVIDQRADNAKSIADSAEFIAKISANTFDIPVFGSVDPLFAIDYVNTETTKDSGEALICSVKSLVETNKYQMGIGTFFLTNVTRDKSGSISSAMLSYSMSDGSSGRHIPVDTTSKFPIPLIKLFIKYSDGALDNDKLNLGFDNGRVDGDEGLRSDSTFEAIDTFKSLVQKAFPAKYTADGKIKDTQSVLGISFRRRPGTANIYDLRAGKININSGFTKRNSTKTQNEYAELETTFKPICAVRFTSRGENTHDITIAPVFGNSVSKFVIGDGAEPIDQIRKLFEMLDGDFKDSRAMFIPTTFKPRTVTPDQTELDLDSDKQEFGNDYKSTEEHEVPKATFPDEGPFRTGIKFIDKQNGFDD